MSLRGAFRDSAVEGSRPKSDAASDRTWTTSAVARRAARGALGGAYATAVMTIYRLPVSRSLPPTAEFWSKYVAGGDPGEHALPALVLHVLYGVLAGVPFAVAFPLVGTVDADFGREVRGSLAGAVYGFALAAFGEHLVLGGLLGQRLERDESLVFVLGHLVYGVALGTWLGSDPGE